MTASLDPTFLIDPSILGPYPDPADAYDELLMPADAQTGHCRPRDAWKATLEAFSGFGPQERARRIQQARRLLRDNGVTYNVFDASPGKRGSERPWILDLLPMVIAHDEWQTLRQGLIQRATLLDRVLADLYGSKQAVRSGAVPPELMHANRNYLYPCDQLRPVSGRYLYLYAADVARGPDGLWVVLADRTQSPLGAGYALENRLVISRTLPDLFSRANVLRLAPFFASLKESLIAAAPSGNDNPHVVVLHPGPGDESYFEQAFLARYLGFTLVESDDLTVRDSRVFLKTLTGLHQVDVILRRMPDHDCDPLELDGRAAAGIVALTHAARRGNVVIANALGSGLAQSPALLPCLPALCEQLLGEELLLPSVATRWSPGGVDASVLDEPRVIKRAFRFGAGDKPRFTDPGDAAARRHIAEQLERDPAGFVVQDRLRLSHAPVFGERGLEPRPMALRLFVAASPDGFTVMPGALCRFASDLASPSVSFAADTGSKDTWVTSDTPVDSFSLLKRRATPLLLQRGGFDLPSRVADNLYWLGRYVERAESHGRLLRAAVSRYTDEGGELGVPGLPALISTLTMSELIPEETLPEALPGQSVVLPVNLEAALSRAIYDRKQAGSLHSSLAAVQRTASIVRDRLSRDASRVLAQVRDPLLAAHRGGVLELSDASNTLDELIGRLAAFSGVCLESMNRGMGWRFMDIGRRIERAAHMLELLRASMIRLPADPAPALEAVLEVADSSMTYRARYRTALLPAPVLDLLLIDETNPRSVAFQLRTIADHVERLPRDPYRPEQSPARRTITRLLAATRLADVEVLATPAQEGGPLEELDKLLADIDKHLPEFSAQLSRRYLSHAQPVSRTEPMGEAD